MIDPNEIFRKHTVRINGGTGCIVQSACGIHSFILTAKHNLEEETNQRLLLKDEIKILDFNEGQIEILSEKDIFRSDEKDFAVIRIPVRDDIRLFPKMLLNSKEQLTLYGYPGARAGKLVPVKEISCILMTYHQQANLYEIEPAKSYGQSYIDGFSGSGVYYVKGSEVFITGIETEMAEEDSPDGRMMVVPIQEIIQFMMLNNLPEIKPPFLNSFEPLIGNCFKILPVLLAGTKDVLHAFAHSNISLFSTPNSLIARYKEEITLPDEQDFLHARGLWTGWLELLIINKLIIANNTISWIESAMSNKTILYVHAEDWTQRLEQILNQSSPRLRMLSNRQDGIVIIHSFPDDKPALTFIDAANIPLSIDDASSSGLIDRVSTEQRGKIIHKYDFVKKIAGCQELIHKTGNEQSFIVSSVQKIIENIYGI